MLLSQQHSINTRALTTSLPIKEEQTLDTMKNYLFDLSYLTVLDLVGENAGAFLQGQVTCDVRAISERSIIQGAQCNLKGRILALLDILDWHGLKLVIPEDLSQFVQDSLTKTALLSRVSIQKNTQLKAFGFYLQNPNELLPFGCSLPLETLSLKQASNYCCYHLGQGLYVLLIQPSLENDLCQPFIEQNQWRGSLTWHTLTMRHGQLAIYPESRGLFLPHRLELHQTPAISFNKGCYKGQEIIARMHYKSQLKHEIRLFEIDTQTSPYSGQKVMALSGETEIGELVDYSFLGNDRYLVAISLLKGTNSAVLFENQTNPIELFPI